MGDAGSMMIGFTIIWLLLSATQNSNTEIMRPVTGLWLIALPLMDMIVVMARRIIQGRSPFRPDRDHLHHLCLRLGLTNIHTLIVICTVATLLAGFGVFGEITRIPEAIMFTIFLGTFAAYALLLLKYWPQRITEKDNDTPRC
jgi:UDP-GlcNAc:undecaprenyl-phosphate GlcNAc-1-phosphate transferase